MYIFYAVRLSNIDTFGATKDWVGPWCYLLHLSNSLYTQFADIYKRKSEYKTARCDSWQVNNVHVQCAVVMITRQRHVGAGLIFALFFVLRILWVNELGCVRIK